VCVCVCVCVCMHDCLGLDCTWLLPRYHVIKLKHADDNRIVEGLTIPISTINTDL